MYDSKIVLALCLFLGTIAPISAKPADLRATQISVRELCGDTSFYSQGTHQGYGFDMTGGVQFSGLAGLNRPPYGGWQAPPISDFKYIEFDLRHQHEDPRPDLSIVLQNSTSGYYYICGGATGTINGIHFKSAVFDNSNTAWVPTPPTTNAICKIAVVYKGGTNTVTETMTETDLTIGYGDKRQPTKYDCRYDTYIIPTSHGGYNTHFNFEP